MDYFKKYLKVAPFSHALWRSLEARALREIKIKPPVLDIGCGFGEFAGVFFKNLVEMGIDINTDDLLLAAQKKKYKKTIFADARNLPFPDKSFKTVVSISTLEHIEEVEPVFSEAYRVLRKNGQLIYTVPTKTVNEMLLGPRLLNSLSFGFLGPLYLKGYHRAFNHQAILDESSWLEMAKKAGFKIFYKSGTISEKQVKFYELGLPFALPTQINRYLFQKRLLFSPRWRVNLLARLFKKLVSDNKVTPANIVVVAEKK